MIHSMQERFNTLDLHDSDVETLSLIQNNEGDWDLFVVLLKNSEAHQISFLKCRSIKTNVHGGLSRRDSIDKFHATTDSAAFRDAGKWPSPLKNGALHYTITTNSGSSIDVVAEAFEMGKRQ